MPATETTLSALERSWQMVDAALADLDDATLASRPNDHSNSIAWTLWHMNRVADNFLHTRFQDKAPIWTSDGWHQKFGMPNDAVDFGMGWDAEKVAAWKPPALSFSTRSGSFFRSTHRLSTRRKVRRWCTSGSTSWCRRRAARRS